MPPIPWKIIVEVNFNFLFNKEKRCLFAGWLAGADSTVDQETVDSDSSSFRLRTVCGLTMLVGQTYRSKGKLSTNSEKRGR